MKCRVCKCNLVDISEITSYSTYEEYYIDYDMYKAQNDIVGTGVCIKMGNYHTPETKEDVIKKLLSKVDDL